MIRAMTMTETFEIELTGRTLLGTLHRPERTELEPLPALLICATPQAGDADASLVDALVETMVAGGWAVAVYAPHPIGEHESANGSVWIDAVDDASAAFRWLVLHERADLTRLGVVGHGGGAVIASCLARRTDQIAGLGLIAPCSKCRQIAKDFNDAAPPGPGSGFESLLPIEDASHFDRPTLVLIAGADRRVPFAESQAYLTALENAEHQVEHFIIARADHAFTDVSRRTLCLTQLLRFFREIPALSHAEANP